MNEDPDCGKRKPGHDAFAVIVLAAGSGTRMGGGKMLLQLQGKPMICHVIDAALASSLRPIVVVGNASVGQVIGDREVSFIINDDPASGMSLSLALGIRATPARCDGAIVMLGDMPAVLNSTLESLAEAGSRNPHKNSIVPVCEGRRGNPVLIRQELFAQASSLSGDTGARGLLLAALELEVADRGILLDVDAPEDVVRVSEHLLDLNLPPESH